MKTHSLNALETVLKETINRQQRHIKIVAGHLPLVYHNGPPGERMVALDIDRWGPFSTESFELGAKLARYAHEQGKEASLVLIVDDDVELPAPDDRPQDYKWASTPRRRLFQKGELPEQYREILKRYDLGRESFVQIERKGAITPLISERELKRTALENGVTANACSLAYGSFINNPDLFDVQKDYLIGFVPGQCKGSICEGVLDRTQGLYSTHAFFPHIEFMGGLLRMGRGYEKIADSCSPKEMYMRVELQET